MDRHEKTRDTVACHSRQSNGLFHRECNVRRAYKLLLFGRVIVRRTRYVGNIIYRCLISLRPLRLRRGVESGGAGRDFPRPEIANDLLRVVPTRLFTAERRKQSRVNRVYVRTFAYIIRVDLTRGYWRECIVVTIDESSRLRAILRRLRGKARMRERVLKIYLGECAINGAREMRLATSATAAPTLSNGRKFHQQRRRRPRRQAIRCTKCVSRNLGDERNVRGERSEIVGKKLARRARRASGAAIATIAINL